MRRRALSGLVALLLALALTVIGNGFASASSIDISGKWISKGDWGATLKIVQTGENVTWQANGSNKQWTQTFVGTWKGTHILGTFTQYEPRSTPKSYTGTFNIFMTDSCHIMIGDVRVPTVKYADAYNMLDREFTMTPCAKNVVWPSLPDALVPLTSVSNGCGGGDAGTNPMWGDDSAFVNSEIPFADDSRWSKELKYPVNFREACKQHDAAYSHAKVKEMALNGGQIIDYFDWTKKRIDDKFLVDMVKICDASIPKTANIALNNCKNNGGFHTVSGAKTRYNVVASTTYSQKIWRGLGFYQDAPALTGTWMVPGVSTGPWSFYQSTRSVNVKWTGGSGQPNLKGEFRGTIISHDKDSTIEGFYVITNNGVPSSIRAMSFSWSPKTPDQLRSSTGINLKRS